MLIRVLIRHLQLNARLVAPQDDDDGYKAVKLGKLVAAQLLAPDHEAHDVVAAEDQD